MEQLRAVVERITFRNEESGYSVIKCRVKTFPELVTVVGSFAEVFVGSVLILDGEWTQNPKFGRQFSVSKYEETLPATVYGIEKYLSSGLVKGIGKAYAQRIVKTFGKDTIDIIENHPERLYEVHGLGQARIDALVKGWQEQKEVKNIMIFLQGHDVSTSHASKIYKTYGMQSLDIVTHNPYRLADDIWGIGFRTADIIAQKLGFGLDRPERLRSGLLYTLNHLAEAGDCYATRDKLIRTAAELLRTGPKDSPEKEQEISLSAELLSGVLDDAIRSEDVITEDVTGPDGGTETRIYLPPFYYAEVGVANRLRAISSAPPSVRVPLDGLETRIAMRTAMNYDDAQMEAIHQAVSHKIFILTGGPGTGKTTTTQGILTAYRDAGARVLLCAPTGRAAKRLSEASGMEAKTIHRLLEVTPPDGYKRNRDYPLEGDVLLVDECSMIDLMLMHHLLKAVPDSMSVILVGDADQLPSVGAGNVLRDLIACGAFPAVTLRRIFRQAAQSRIIVNAHRINEGQMPDLSNGRDSDFFFVSCESAEEAPDTITALVKTKLPGYFGVGPDQIQVLTPMQRSPVGAENLNRVLQEALNPDGAALRHAAVTYRVRDKVMQIRNNYDKEVFNGDIGTVASVDSAEGTLTVIFDDRRVAYERADLNELVPAYATTIHKSQGSEYPVVVIPVFMAHFPMLQRNLIYTAVTRGRKGVVLVGTRKALAYAVRHVTVDSRATSLSLRTARAFGLPDPQKDGSGAGPVTILEAPEESVPEPPKKTAPTESGTVRTGIPVSEIPASRTDRDWLDRDLFERLDASKFRSSFRLDAKDRQYVLDRGMDEIRSHAVRFLTTRIGPAQPKNDGNQTPMGGHPVFRAMHATGCCCRKCLEKWHGIPRGRDLTAEEIQKLSEVLMTWIRRQMEQSQPK